MKIQLVVNADDLGLAPSVNRAIAEAHHAGNVTSATLMVNMPGSEDAVRVAGENPALGVGLHLNLTEGVPLAPGPGLRGPDGGFLPRRALVARWLTGRLDAGALRAELEAQLGRMESWGLVPTHLDGHQHVHMIPGVFAALLPVLRERRLPVRLVRPPPEALRWRAGGPGKLLKQFANLAAARWVARRYERTIPDYLVSIHDRPFDPQEGLSANGYASLLAGLPSRAVVEVMVHPYRPDVAVDGMYGPGKGPFLARCREEWRVLASGPVFDPDAFEMVDYRTLGGVRIAPVQEDELGAVAALAAGDGDTDEVERSLRRWYFGNPAGAFDLRVAWRGGRAEGMATANCLRFRLEGREGLVAMPQKVLTSPRIRGWGVFGRMYREVEDALVRRGDVDLFLTVTNAMSTPIFLERFGYHRRPSPITWWIPPLPGSSGGWHPVSSVEEAFPVAPGAPLPFAPVKDAAYLAWRYADAAGRGYLLLTRNATRDGAPLLCLARVVRKGAPLLLLMDAVGVDSTDAADILRAVSRIAFGEKTAGVLVLENAFWREALGRHPLALKTPARFNVLARRPPGSGMSEPERFEFSFGDWDFF